jgi:glycosyltransferase involved in cell wall biosynthesis
VTPQFSPLTLEGREDVPNGAEHPGVGRSRCTYKPRILHYLSSPAWGGAEEYALSLLAAMPECGFVPYLAAPRQLLKAVEQRLSLPDFRCIAIEQTSSVDWRPATRFINFLRAQRIDLVHSHLFLGSLFASPLARLAGVSTVETFHLREVWREGKWLKGSFWLDRQVGRFVDRYIAVSHAAERHLLENKRIERSKVVTIHNGRDLARFHQPTQAETARARSELGVSDKQVMIVLGRLEQQKGHAFLIEAFRKLAPRWPKLIALFAGSGALDSELKARCAAAGLTDRITFLGYRNDTERLLSAADLLVLPSLFEGLPLVAIETLAMARPIVATDVEGTREIVADGDTGLLVRAADPAALADGIERILADPALGARLGRQGRTLVEQNFDIHQQIARTVDVYRRLLDQRMGQAGPLKAPDTLEQSIGLT